MSQDNHQTNQNLQEATFGAGCFWCVEAIFGELKGVQSVEAGYAGGHVKNPSYKEVCSGNTGHAEVARIVYEPEVISFEELLQVFWHLHDPTTKNRQGADVGTQYRSVIFYHNEKQKESAERLLEEIDQSNLWQDPIVTDIEPLSNYYPAEDYHQDYFEKHKAGGYCQTVIAPKIKKLHQNFGHIIKEKEKQ